MNFTKDNSSLLILHSSLFTRIVNLNKKIQLSVLQKVYLLCIVVCFSSCSNIYKSIDNRNFSNKYKPGEQTLHALYEVFQPSANKLELHFKLYPFEFKFDKSKKDTLNTAFVSLFFKVTKTYKSKQIIDSLTQNYIFRRKPLPYFIGKLPINLPDNEPYILEVFLRDHKTGEVISEVINIQKDAIGLANSYMIVSDDAMPTFKNYVHVNDTFMIKNSLKTSNELQISKLDINFSPALPPDMVASTKIQADISKQEILSFHKMDTSRIILNDEGVYLLSNQSIKQQKSFSVFNHFYPYVKHPEQLLNSLYYLCADGEMEYLHSLNNPKQAVDTFWQSITPDLNKARELIRVYYNRVQLANYFFTEKKEGWLTDRGMIYIIFGSPSYVSINKDGELWVYGQNERTGLSFFFYREHHPILGEYFELSRSDRYARIWFNAISTWRKGKVFSIN